ncbi:MAG: DNA/RNA non-specific endonuclease [Bacteroidota bacterium]
MKKKVIIFIALFLLILSFFLLWRYYPSLFHRESSRKASPAAADISGISSPVTLKIDRFEEGWPVEQTGDTLLSSPGYTLSYDEDEEQAAWVAYVLTSADVSGGGEERTDNFRSDTRVLTGSATPDDYKGSGYDRGHLAPAADMGWSASAMSESFLMSNMSPQVPAFNRGIWKKLEEQVRDWAVDCDSVYVITGPVLNSCPSHIGKNEVGVPEYYFKVILDLSPPNKMIAFLLPNAGSKASIYHYAITVDSLETFTGYDFFAGINDKASVDRLESCSDTTLWILK